MYTVSYFAVYLNLVDITINKIHWTTPIILSGYQATGSISGSILQIINVIIAVLIYKPFILLYDKKSDSANAENMNSIIEILKTSEENLIPITLTELKSPAGILAKNLVNDIKEDLQKENIQIKFQPQYNKLEQCIGAESLLRWTHPIYGTVYPPLVLKLAKESNLLWDLESFILELCIKNLEHFNQKFGSDFKLSVNITVATFYNPAFLPFLEKMLKKYNVIPQTLCLEITEEMKLENNKETNSIFNKIKELGCKIALDDFSMGHTSLKYLQDNHFDSVKIDGSLVKAMLNNSRSKDIIASIMFLANSLDFEVIAEFVETKFERKTLESLGGFETSENIAANAQAIDGKIDNSLSAYVDAAESGDYNAFVKAKANLLENLNKKQIATGQSAGVAGYISNLTSERDSLLSTLNPKGEVRTEKAGFFIKSSDGYENILSVENIDELILNFDTNSCKIGITAGASTPQKLIDEVVSVIANKQ